MLFRDWEISRNPSYHCENKFHQYDEKSQVPFGTVVQVLSEFCGSRIMSLSGATVVPAISSLNPQEDDAKFLEFRRELRVVLLEQGGFQKCLLKYP